MNIGEGFRGISLFSNLVVWCPEEGSFPNELIDRTFSAACTEYSGILFLES